MNVEIITIGDELLIGQVIDTNSAWMAKELNACGFRISHISTVSDNSDQIKEAIDHATAYADIILMTGGLGPTRDDLTRDTLCEYFNTGLRTDEKVLNDLNLFFTARGKKLTDSNRMQADVPEICTTIYNKIGTAPGMWFYEKGKVYVSMPGVPFEMKAMMNDFIIPKLSELFTLPAVYHQHLLTVGVGESFLSDMLRTWENSLPDYIKMAYLPSVAMVRLRLSCYDSNKEREIEVDKFMNEAALIVKDYVFALGNETPEVIIGNLLKRSGATLAVAESCTGGYISHLITSVPGCSQYYIGSSVSYANEVKTRFLGVDENVINSKGAVSEEVAVAMAAGVRERLGATWAIATTGVAGPDGGTEEKPVGTVWIGIAGPDCLYARLFHIGSNRQRNIQFFTLMAFNMLNNELVGKHVV